MAAHSFDHTRCDLADYNHLDTAIDRCSLMTYLARYAEWLRKNTTTTSTSIATDPAAREGARQVTQIIDNDDVWSNAQMMIPELRENKAYRSPHAEMNHFLDIIKHRLTDPPPAESQLTFEERRLWYTQRAGLEHVVSVAAAAASQATPPYRLEDAPALLGRPLTTEERGELSKSEANIRYVAYGAAGESRAPLQYKKEVEELVRDFRNATISLWLS